MDILIRQFTDPICTWCWGSEPIVKKLEYKIEGVRVGFVMGGLVRDIKDFASPGASIDEINKLIHDHWIQASSKHFMPVTREPLDLFTDNLRSSYPQNRAYKAAQVQDEEKAKKLLRRIREATFVDGLRTCDVNVLIYLADQVGLNQDKFAEYMVNGRAEEDFEKDRELTRSYDVKGFPSYSIKHADKELLIKGFQIYESFVEILTVHMGLDIKEKNFEKTKDELDDFIDHYQRVSPREIAYVFDLDKAEYEELMGQLLTEKRAFKEGPFIVKKENLFNKNLQKLRDLYE